MMTRKPVDEYVLLPPTAASVFEVDLETLEDVGPHDPLDEEPTCELPRVQVEAASPSGVDQLLIAYLLDNDAAE